MKEYNELEFNKLCAEFLGYELITPDKRRNPSEWSYSYWEHKNKANVHTSKKVLGRDEYLQFHFDWNWIMEVLEKIYSLDIYYDKYIMYNSSQFTDGKIELSTNKGAVVQAIWEFLNWYKNETKIH